MNIQDEAIKIHHQYGTSEKANYKIQLMCEEYAEEYHRNKLKNHGVIGDVMETPEEAFDRGYTAGMSTGAKLMGKGSL